MTVSHVPFSQVKPLTFCSLIQRSYDALRETQENVLMDSIL
jgi:hypothetical protein